MLLIAYRVGKWLWLWISGGVITDRRKLKGKVELSEEKLVLVSLCLPHILHVLPWDQNWSPMWEGSDSCLRQVFFFVQINNLKML